MDISFLYAVSLFSQSFKELLLFNINNPLSNATFTFLSTQSRLIRERKDKHYFYSDNNSRKKVSKTHFSYPVKNANLSSEAGSKGKHSFCDLL